MPIDTINVGPSSDSSDHLVVALSMAVSLENKESLGGQDDELYSEISSFDTVLDHGRQLARSYLFIWLIVTFFGLLVAVVPAFQVLEINILLRSEVLRLALPFVGAILGIIGVYGISAFVRRKAQLEFESEVLKKYVQTRNELLTTRGRYGRQVSASQ